MRFPEWARNDTRLRLRFLCSVMALHVSADGSVYQLARLAKVKYPTALKAIQSGRMTTSLAAKMLAVAEGSGVKAAWLVAPELLQLNDDGEVIE